MALHGYSVEDVVIKLQKISSLHSMDIISVLSGVDFLSDVDPKILKVVASSIFFIERPQNSIICRQGKFDDFFYLLLSGRLSATIPTDDNPKYELYSLQAGDFFGEEIVFSSEPRDNTIIVEEDMLGLSMNKKIIELLIDNSESMRHIMDRKYIERKLRRDLRRVPIFTHLNEALFEDVLNSVHLVSRPKETTIFSEHDPADTFYLIRSGEVDVYRKLHGTTQRIAILGEGQFFGEMALLTGDTRNATIKTSRNSDLVTLSRDTFLSIVKKDINMSRTLELIIEERKEHSHESELNPDAAILHRKLLDLNRNVYTHLDILAQCTIDTAHGSALLASLPESRYPYVYPRDSACASRFLYSLVASPLKSGELAFRYLAEIARFMLNCQREDGFWGQRYGINCEDKGIYKQEDNVAHGVTILCRYLLAARKKEVAVSQLEQYLEAIAKGARFARTNYYRNEIHLFYSTTSIHESAIEQGYSIWVNYAYLLMLRLIERVGEEYGVSSRFDQEIILKHGFEPTLDNVFCLSERYVRRLKPDGVVDLRPDITLLSPFFFSTGMEEHYFNNTSKFAHSVAFIEDTLWDPELKMLQRYLPFIEDPDTHIHAGNGPWLQYTAILAQYYFFTQNSEKGNQILEILDHYKTAEGYLCEHLTTPERFYEFKRLEWIPGHDSEKEFDHEILVPGISYDNIVEELQHMKQAYQEVERQANEMTGRGHIAFATPLMWSHAEYGMALMLKTDQEILKLNSSRMK